MANTDAVNNFLTDIGDKLITMRSQLIDADTQLQRIIELGYLAQGDIETKENVAEARHNMNKAKIYIESAILFVASESLRD